MSEGMGDVVFQLRDDIRENGWIPGRGDYGTDHSSDLIAIIEEHNCIHGCVLSGNASARKEFGPGGNCHILARIAIGDGKPIRELDPRRSGPHCTAREAPPPKPPRFPQPLPAPPGMEPLF